jgi:hypothetical protein
VPIPCELTAALGVPTAVRMISIDESGPFFGLRIILPNSISWVLYVAAGQNAPANLFWLTYRHSDDRDAGVVAIESRGLLHARLFAGPRPIESPKLASGHQLDQESAGQIPETKGASLGVVGSRPLRDHLFDDAAG